MLALRLAGEEGVNWQIQAVPHLSAETALEVGTIACIRETRQEQGSYQDGELAYRLSWAVRLVSWPAKAVIAARTFKGTPAPGVKFGSGPGIGRPPTPDLLAWLLEAGLDDGHVLLMDDDTTALAFSPDGALLAAGHSMLSDVSYDTTESGSTITIHDVASHKQLLRLRGHSDLVSSVAFSPDGSQLASGSRDQTVRLWNMANGAALQTFDEPKAAVVRVAFSPDGARLIAGYDSGQIVMWDIASGSRAGQLDDVRGAFGLSADGKTLLAVHQGRLVAYDLASLQQSASLVSFDLVQQISADAATPLLALAWYDSVTLLSANGQLYQQLKLPSGTLTGMGFVSGGQLATTSSEGLLTLWDPKSGQAVQTRAGHAAAINSLAVSPDGALVATSGADGTVQLWAVADGRLK